MRIDHRGRALQLKPAKFDMRRKDPPEVHCPASHFGSRVLDKAVALPPATAALQAPGLLGDVATGSCYPLPMRIQVLCFGSLRELLAPQVEVELPQPATAGDLWRTLLERYPALAPYEGAAAIAVNQTFASSTTSLDPGDQVALLPPVSGGSPDVPMPKALPQEVSLPLVSAHACLQREPIDSTRMLAEIKAGEDGAACLFDGVVRNHTRNRPTLYLEYDSYPEMALAQMEQLAEAALAKFAVREVRIAHRVGRLEIGESSVVIVVASAHRAPAFEACRWIIDTLKRTVPIWKKEFFADGACWADGEPFPPEVAL